MLWLKLLLLLCFEKTNYPRFVHPVTFDVLLSFWIFNFFVLNIQPVEPQCPPPYPFPHPSPFPPSIMRSVNPFTPEPSVTACAYPHPFYCLWHHQFQWSKTTLFTDLCLVKRSFKPYQNEHNSVKDTEEKGKKLCNTALKISLKILFHYPPTFPVI